MALAGPAWLWRLAGLLLVVTCAATHAASTPPGKTGKPWVDMDYGPFLTASIEAPHPRTNLAYKGIAINLGKTAGSADNEAIVFDTDLLRYAAGWTGNFLALQGVVFDGAHWAYPAIDGRQSFGNPMLPGWARDGSFADPREYPFGPLPREWARWQGLYLHGQQVIFAYTVGGVPVLEMPSLERRGEISAFARVLNLAASPTEQVLQLAREAGVTGQCFDRGTLQPVPLATPTGSCLAVLGWPAPSARDGPAPPTALDQGLLGHWEFDEGSGSVARDQSGQDRALRLNAATWTADGQRGAALQFDGRGFAEVDRPAELDFTRTDLTVAAWIRTRHDGTLLARTASGDQWVPDGVTFFVRGGRLGFDVGWVGAVQGVTPLTDDRWHHVAMRWSHADGRVTLFVNGREERAATLKPRQAVPGAVVRVGFTAPNFPASPWYRGRLDELRIYGRALASAEIAALAGPPAGTSPLAAAVVGAPPGARWEFTAQGDLRLRLPASTEPVRCAVLLWRGEASALPAFAELAQTMAPPPDLAAFTRGGPARWDPPLTTRAQAGSGPGPYVVDTLTVPEDNPWHSWMRFGGLDFFADGQRAALCTWNGDVWTVSGVGEPLGPLTWRRFATGLFQPLGLKIVEDRIYVLGRDQVTRLHDLNGDGEADFYENFNNDCMVSEHFHEFATDLKTDADGNFYYIKCARHALPASHPHHGTLLKLPPDGSRLEVVARGLRAVNGLGVGPRGELTCVDNQGHWMPGNRINWMQPGGWYGNQWAWPYPVPRADYDPPLSWMHNFVDRSGGTHLWVPHDHWGLPRDDLLTLSYGMGQVLLVLHEEVNGLRQGGVTRFPLEFDTGVMRGVFHPRDHQLYACGLYGWAGNKTKPGGFYRIRYTGQPVNLPRELRVASDGVALGFTDPLDPASALDPGNYDVKVWNLHWSARYGSPDFKLDGTEGRDTWRVQSVSLSADHKTVFLELPALQPVMQMHLTFHLKAADGARVDNFVHHTIHQLGTQPGRVLLGAGAIASAAPERVVLPQAAPGLRQQLTRREEPARTDHRTVRLAALFVPRGAAPTPFLDAGPLRVVWRGFVKRDLNEAFRFHAEGQGALRLRVQGELVLEIPPGPLSGHTSAPVVLRSGLSAFELEYDSPADGDAEVRLGWSSPRLAPEPVPAATFVHDPTEPALHAAELARAGRHLFATRHCLKCHADDTLDLTTAMPELAADAPALDGVGDRLLSAWMAEWLANPGAARADAFMPKLLHGASAAADARDLAAFLATLTSPAPGRAAPAVDWADAELVATGRKHFAEQGCVACHRLPGDQPFADDPRQTLDHVRAKWQLPALVEFLRNPARHYRWTRMPDFQFSAGEAAALTAYLLSRAAPMPADAVSASAADAERGRHLALTLGCVNCHTLAGADSQLRAPTLAALMGRSWEQGCVVVTAHAASLAAASATGPRPSASANAQPPAQRAGLPDRASTGRAPDFGFDASQVEALRAFGQTPVRAPLQRATPAEFAERHYRLLRCNACHGRDPETDFWSGLKPEHALALPRPAANPYDSDDEEPEAGTVHLGRPNLSLAGEKLHADWMHRLFSGGLPYKPRASLPGRMPVFAAASRELAAGLAHQHGYSTNAPPLPPAEPALADLGRRLAGVSEGFSCVVCHDVGPQKALAGADTATINFAYITERLRPTFYERYLRDPQHILPGTMMPNFINADGTTPIKALLDGDPDRQFTALWHYLLHVRATSGP